jgi:biopolymer transport protein ExbB
MFRKTLLTFMVCGFFASNVVAQEAETPVKDEPLTLQQLLERVKEGRVTDNSANKKRERQFINERNKRKSMLDNVNRKIGVEEARSERLEATFNANELQLG